MPQSKNVRWSLAEVVADLGGPADAVAGSGITTLLANDRFFIGNGCEALSGPGIADDAATRATHDARARANVSVCVCGPTS